MEDQISASAPKGKIWKIIGSILGAIIIIFLLLFWYGSKLDNKQASTNIINKNINMSENNKSITLKEFFPNISGNIADYEISIPTAYIKYAVPDDLALGTFLWGEPEDIKTISANSQALSFNQAKAGVFRIRFSPNIAIDANSQIIDGNGPINESSFASQGIQDIHFTKGSFAGISAVPVIVVTGTVKDKPLFMAYLYSPVDNLVILTSLQGGTDNSVNSIIWNSFVNSLNIK